MADFKIAFDRTDANEGGYSNHPADRGGETYRGISRKFWSRWPGWAIIDQCRAMPGFPSNLKDVPRLPQLVLDFYKLNFWDPLKADLISSQAIAEELYDTGVNCGRGTTTRFLQEALNVLNNQETRWPDLEPDGVFGKGTLDVLEKCLAANFEDVLLILLNGRQIEHYYQLMLHEPTQEAFAVGWLRNRCRIRENRNG
jgi:lysozyme family protein